MKQLLIFKKDIWNAREISDFIKKILKIDEIKIRNLHHGFNYLIYTNDKIIDNIQMQSQKEIIILDIYSKNDRFEYSEDESSCITKNNSKTLIKNKILLEKNHNLLWDIINLVPPYQDKIKLVDLYDFIKIYDNTVIDELGCREIFLKKYRRSIQRKLLDIISLINSNISIYLALNNQKNLKFVDYTIFFSLIVIVRAQADKIALLIADIDDTIDYQKLINAWKSTNSLKKSFIKLALPSDNLITKDAINLLKNIDILEDNFRTPEIHNIGRSLELVYLGYGEKLANIAYSYQTDILNLLKKIILHLKENQSKFGIKKLDNEKP